MIYTKRLQEDRALINLERQGFTCYLPKLRVQKVRKGSLTIELDALFPRYLFIQMGVDDDARWGLLRSTRGVTRLVSFGTQPATIDDALIETLRARDQLDPPKPLYRSGERVQLTAGPFMGLDAVYLMPDGEQRAFVLIELLKTPAKLPVELRHIAPIST